MAIDEFMRENPHWRGKIVFTIIGISATERGLDYRLTQRDVQTYVNKLNDEYGVDNEELVCF
jgi:trehalose-6-phosphate synthase